MKMGGADWANCNPLELEEYVAQKIIHSNGEFELYKGVLNCEKRKCVQLSHRGSCYGECSVRLNHETPSFLQDKLETRIEETNIVKAKILETKER